MIKAKKNNKNRQARKSYPEHHRTSSSLQKLACFHRSRFGSNDQVDLIVRSLSADPFI
jgi:hypothetical protein